MNHSAVQPKSPKGQIICENDVYITTAVAIILYILFTVQLTHHM